MSKTPFLTRHRSLLILALLTVTLAASSAANRLRLEDAAATTALPVTAAPSAVATYREERDADYLTDVAALQAVSADATLEASTREAAAQTLTRLVADREAAAALETALSATSLAPCAAIVTDGQVTLVTAKTTLTEADSALVTTLAAIHAGADAGDVHVLTGQ